MAWPQRKMKKIVLDLRGAWAGFHLTLSEWFMARAVWHLRRFASHHRQARADTEMIYGTPAPRRPRSENKP